MNFPFCDGCNFCDSEDFVDVKSRIPNYITALVNEIRAAKKNAEGREISSVFFGGSGASLISIKHLGAVMKELRKTFKFTDDVEITLEVSPAAKVANVGAWKELGINRVSLTALALDEIVLKTMGKTYSVDSIRKMLDAVMDAGFSVNVDISIAVPIPKNIAQMDLRRGPEAELENLLVFYPMIDHISIYETEIQDGTNMARALDYEELYMQSPDDSVCDLVLLSDVLHEFGFSHYDTCHWARDGAESIYNRSHLEIENECFAFGVDASGLVNDERYDNFDDLDMYILSPEKTEFREKRTTLDKVNEAIMNQLQRPNGIDIAGIKKLGVDIMAQKQHEINELRAMRIIKATKNSLKLTKHGVLMLNYALGELLLDDLVAL